MAHTQLHALKIMASMMADKYMASFEMLVARMEFKKAALEDTFIPGLPQLILSKVYS